MCQDTRHIPIRFFMSSYITRIPLHAINTRRVIKPLIEFMMLKELNANTNFQTILIQVLRIDDTRYMYCAHSKAIT